MKNLKNTNIDLINNNKIQLNDINFISFNHALESNKLCMVINMHALLITKLHLNHPKLL